MWLGISFSHLHQNHPVCGWDQIPPGAAAFPGESTCKTEDSDKEPAPDKRTQELREERKNLWPDKAFWFCFAWNKMQDEPQTPAKDRNVWEKLLWLPPTPPQGYLETTTSTWKRSQAVEESAHPCGAISQHQDNSTRCHIRLWKGPLEVIELLQLKCFLSSNLPGNWLRQERERAKGKKLVRSKIVFSWTSERM